MAVYKIYGGPASPYSLKTRAVFRYLRLPHTWTVPMEGFDGSGGLGEGDANSVLAKARKGVVPVVQFPDGSFKADSTPMMLYLSEVVPERSLVHPNPGIAFLSHLIEDMADEYLPMPFFYFRWTTDAAWCGRRQMIGWNGAMDDASLEPLARAFTERQQAQLGPRASLPQEQVQENYEVFLAALEKLLSRSLFLFGTRPSLAEFGLHGQLTQYAVDPFVSSLMKEKAVRVFQWEQFLDDLSGIEGDWAAPEDCLTEELQGLIASLAPGYFFMMEMMRQAIGTEGLANLAGSLNGQQYRVKCWLALKAELAGLPAADRALIRPLLEAVGAWEPLQFQAGEEAHVVPIEMA